MEHKTNLCFFSVPWFFGNHRSDIINTGSFFSESTNPVFVFCSFCSVSYSTGEKRIGRIDARSGQKFRFGCGFSRSRIGISARYFRRTDKIINSFSIDFSFHKPNGETLSYFGYIGIEDDLRFCKITFTSGIAVFRKSPIHIPFIVLLFFK